MFKFFNGTIRDIISYGLMIYKGVFDNEKRV